MSLYYDASTVLSNPETGGSLKSRVYSNKSLKSTPAHVFALISETLKYQDILAEVVEKSGILAIEKKLSPTLALLLLHDLLLAKNGIAASANHVLKQAVLRHKARLSAEFTKARLRKGFANFEGLKASIESQASIANGGDPGSEGARHPRWVRVNTLKSSTASQLATTFNGYNQVDSLDKLFTSTENSLMLDPHILNLLALSPNIDIMSNLAYRSGELIIQDKASCFPAYLLDPRPGDGDIIDACAAPGNKTTHLAALASERKGKKGNSVAIHAFERDNARAKTLKKMTSLAGSQVIIHAGEDFLKTDPNAEQWKTVGALLLDPSCSGSGIVGRDDAPKLILPKIQSVIPLSSSRKSKKRKRKATDVPKYDSKNLAPAEQGLLDEEVVTNLAEDQLKTRLEKLSMFQLKILLHAFSFPQAHKVTYSTCSVHAEENEHVVTKALDSAIARDRGWRILKRSEQIVGLGEWKTRGLVDECGMDGVRGEDTTSDIAEGCIRCNKGDGEGTMGFFVAGFVRNSEGTGRELELSTITHAPEQSEGEDYEEWSGFSDEEEDREETSYPAMSHEKKQKR